MASSKHIKVVHVGAPLRWEYRFSDNRPGFAGCVPLQTVRAGNQHPPALPRPQTFRRKAGYRPPER